MSVHKIQRSIFWDDAQYLVEDLDGVLAVTRLVEDEVGIGGQFVDPGIASEVAAVCKGTPVVIPPTGNDAARQVPFRSGSARCRHVRVWHGVARPSNSISGS